MILLDREGNEVDLEALRTSGDQYLDAWDRLVGALLDMRDWLIDD